MSGDASLRPILASLADGATLDQAAAAKTFDAIMDGDASPAQIGAILMALRVRGETVIEIAGAVRSLRARMLPVTAPADAIDVCGTGGDGAGSFNVSTAASFVVAACGVTVAKHGNRAQTSRCGAADVLAAAGIAVEPPLPVIERALTEVGIAFLFAPRHHPALRAVAPIRAELGTRTIFNLAAPLANPAGVRRQLVGVFSPRWLEPLARVLDRTGSVAAWLVHGEGLDELTTTGPTQVAALADGRITSFVVTPEELGLRRAKPADIAGGTAADNAAMLRSILSGAQGPLRDIVALNAAAGLVVAGRRATLRDGLDMAMAAIDTGRAAAVLDRLIAVTSAAS